jgi:cytosine deaminase
MSDFDLVIHQARHDRTGALIDVGIRDGLIAALEPGGIGPGAREIDAGGRMVSPALIEPHFHLENALLWDGALNQSGTPEEATRLYAAIKRDLTPDDSIPRAATSSARGTSWPKRARTSSLTPRCKTSCEIV